MNCMCCLKYSINIYLTYIILTAAEDVCGIIVLYLRTIYNRDEQNMALLPLRCGLQSNFRNMKQKDMEFDK
jgi:hypothetical protein